MDIEAYGGWPGLLGRLVAGSDLAAEETEAAFGAVLAGEATQSQLAGMLVALRMKGETVDELSGMLAAMRAAGTRVPLDPSDPHLVDTCGTGGDRSHSINVSTIAALVVAGAGGRVCKHGNRAASSACGSADVLEALGVAIELGPAQVARCVTEAGIGFCLATAYHPAMRHAGPTRRELGLPTAFNYLGPLANPARVRRQVVGVSDPTMAERMLRVLHASGAERAMVVYGHDGLDELTTTTTSQVFELRDGAITERVLDPRAVGIEPTEPGALRGGDAATNAKLARAVLGGQAGPHRDIVVLNAAAAIIVADLAADLAEAVALAARSIDSGAAATALDRLVALSTAAS